MGAARAGAQACGRRRGRGRVGEGKGERSTEMSDLMQPQRRAVDSGADSDLCVQSRSAFVAQLVSFCVRSVPRLVRLEY